MTDAPSVTLEQRARRVGEAVVHSIDQSGIKLCATGSCLGCRAEAAALAELRALRDACIEAINSSEGDIDFALFKLRALGEPRLLGDPS